MYKYDIGDKECKEEEEKEEELQLLQDIKYLDLKRVSLKLATEVQVATD